MVFSNLLKSAAGTCPFCHQKAGLISREHPECRRTHQAGWQEMVDLAAQAAGSPDFDENQLRLTMAAVAQRSYGNQGTVNHALEAGWKLGVNHSMADQSSHEKSNFEHSRPSLNEKPAPQGGLSCNVTSAN